MVSYLQDLDIVETYNGSSWIGLGGYLTYGASRQLAATNNFSNQTTFADMPNAADKTALDLSVVKKQNSSVLLVTMHMPVYFTSGAAQTVYSGLNIGGTDYGIGGIFIQAATSNGTISGSRIISGLNAGTYAVKPRFAAGGASAFSIAQFAYVTYTVQELPQ